MILTTRSDSSIYATVVESLSHRWVAPTLCGDQSRRRDRRHVQEDQRALNMTASELEKWLGIDESKEVGQEAGDSERIVALLTTKKSDLSADDYAHMRNVVGYAHRHSRNGRRTISTTRRGVIH